MPLWIFPALLAFFALISLSSAIWLLLHLQDVARIFVRSGSSDLVPQPTAPQRASRSKVWVALFFFNLGWIVCLIIWLLVMSGDANALVRPN